MPATAGPSSASPAGADAEAGYPASLTRVGGISATAWLLGSLAAIAVTGIGFALAHWDWYPVSDWALTDLETLHLGDRFPLVGAYSRAGWSHPGPAFTLLMAAGTLTTGVSAGMLLAMLVLQLAAVALAWFAVRSQSRPAAVLICSALLITWAVGTEATGMLLPWNPWASLLAAGTLLAVAWAAAAGARLGAVALFPLGSFLLQAHAGTAVFVGATCLVACLLVVLPRHRPSPVPWRWWGVGLAVTTLLWLPSVLDQLTSVRGNLSLMLQLEAGRVWDWSLGWNTVTGAFSLDPFWWTPQGWLPTYPGVPWLLLLPVIATLVAIKGRDTAALPALTVCWAAIGAIVPTAAHLDQPLSYLVQWIPAVVMTTWAVSGWVLLRASGHEAAVLRVAPALLVLPALLVAGRIVLNPPPSPMQSAAVAAALDTAAEFHRRTAEEVVVGVPEGASWDSLMVLPGVLVALERHGVPVRGSFALPATLRSLAPGDSSGSPTLLVRTIPAGPPPPGWQVVREMPSGLSADEEQQIEALTDPGYPLSQEELVRRAERVNEIREGRTGWQVLLRRDESR